MAQERSGNQRPSRGGRPGTGGASGTGRGGAPSGGSRGGSSDRRGAPGAGGQSRSSGSGAGKPSSGKPSSGKPSYGKPGSGSKPGYGPKSAAGGNPSGQGRSGDDRRSSGSRPARGGDDRRSGGPRGTGRESREERLPRTADQEVYDGPDLPEHITGDELDKSIQAQLKALPPKLAARVARHLAAAGTMVDDDPETAYRHTLAARARAPRLAVVREATGEAAYAAGHYAEALAELRAAKRMNGATDYLPIMADCHRALGQPQQAVKLAQSPSVANFPSPAKAEMTIVEAGARRDMGQMDAALRVLEQAPLMSKSRESWVVRLRYAYADTLEAAGRPTEALTWFHRTDAIDSEELTDAAERAAALEASQPD